MLNGRTTFKVSTKPDADGDAKETVLTIIYDGCSEGIMRALATQALIVKAQGGWRKHGIPDSAEVHMKDFAPGTRHAGMTPDQAKQVVLAEAAADKDKRAKMIADLQAMDAVQQQ